MATRARIQMIVVTMLGAPIAPRIHTRIAATMAMTATWITTSRMALPVRMSFPSVDFLSRDGRVGRLLCPPASLARVRGAPLLLLVALGGGLLFLLALHGLLQLVSRAHVSSSVELAEVCTSLYPPDLDRNRADETAAGDRSPAGTRPPEEKAGDATTDGA